MAGARYYFNGRGRVKYGPFDDPYTAEAWAAIFYNDRGVGGTVQQYTDEDVAYLSGGGVDDIDRIEVRDWRRAKYTPDYDGNRGYKGWQEQAEHDAEEIRRRKSAGFGRGRNPRRRSVNLTVIQPGEAFVEAWLNPEGDIVRAGPPGMGHLDQAALLTGRKSATPYTVMKEMRYVRLGVYFRVLGVQAQSPLTDAQVRAILFLVPFYRNVSYDVGGVWGKDWTERELRQVLSGEYPTRNPPPIFTIISSGTQSLTYSRGTLTLNTNHPLSTNRWRIWGIGGGGGAVDREEGLRRIMRATGAWNRMVGPSDRITGGEVVEALELIKRKHGERA